MQLVHEMEELNAVQHVLDLCLPVFCEINDALAFRPSFVVSKNRHDGTIRAAEFCICHDAEAMIRLEHRANRVDGDILEEQIL